MSTSNTQIIDAVKAWLLPGIVGLGFMMFQTNLQEMKLDIKKLLAQSERDQVKIEYLEQEVKTLREKLDELATNELPIKTPTDEIPPTYAIIPNKQDGTFVLRSYPTGV